MPIYNLKFECYVQHAAWKKIRAKSLEQAMAKAMLMDFEDLEWVEEDEAPTSPRLYGVFDSENNQLVSVELGHLFDTSWTAADLREQWGRKPLSDEELTQMNAALKQWLLAMRHVPPAFGGELSGAKWVHLYPWDVDGSSRNGNEGGR